MITPRRYLTMSPDEALARGDRLASAEAGLYGHIRTSRGTYKSTRRGRLLEIDSVLFRVMARLGIVARTVMDVGVASGVTTLDWLDGFEARGQPVRMIATDLHFDV